MSNCLAIVKAHLGRYCSSGTSITAVLRYCSEIAMSVIFDDVSNCVAIYDRKAFETRQ